MTTTAEDISAETHIFLCKEYQSWANAQGLPAMSADELIHEEITDEQRKHVSAFILRWEAMELANAALPINDDEWGSERQIEAQNAFFEAVEKAISAERFAELDSYCHKATTREMIEEGLKALRGEPSTIMTLPKWQIEFPDFPVADMPTIPASFEDTSWHNDTCPSFTSDELGLTVFVDYADKAKREVEEGSRFNLIRQDHGVEVGCGLMDSDDWSEILKLIAEVAICHKWVAKVGGGFHPDTRGKDYSPKLTADEVREYDADMDLLFASACDPYELGVMAMANAGCFDSKKVAG